MASTNHNNPGGGGGGGGPFHVHLRRLRTQAFVSRASIANAAGITARQLADVESGIVAATGALYDAAVARWPTLGSHDRPDDPAPAALAVSPAVTHYFDNIEPILAIRRRLNLGPTNMSLIKLLIQLWVAGDYTQVELDRFFGP